MNRLSIAITLLGVTSAQNNCETKDDCDSPNNFCCAKWTIVDFAANSNWGPMFPKVWGGPDEMKRGASFTSCTNENYIEKHQADLKADKNGGQCQVTNNYADLQNFLDKHEGARESLSLDSDDNVDEWIEIWNGDVETQKNFLITVACVDDEDAKSADEAAACLEDLNAPEEDEEVPEPEETEEEEEGANKLITTAAVTALTAFAAIF